MAILHSLAVTEPGNRQGSVWKAASHFKVGNKGPAQRTETKVACSAPNRMTRLSMPMLQRIR